MATDFQKAVLLRNDAAIRELLAKGVSAEEINHQDSHGNTPLNYLCAMGIAEDVIVARDVLLLVLGVILAQHRYGPLPVHHLGKMGTFLLLVSMPVLVLGAAFPVLDAWAEPVGWAAALWGVFLYWWAGIIYAVQTGRLIRIPEDATAGGSARVDR